MPPCVSSQRLRSAKSHGSARTASAGIDYRAKRALYDRLVVGAAKESESGTNDLFLVVGGQDSCNSRQVFCSRIANNCILVDQLGIAMSVSIYLVAKAAHQIPNKIFDAVRQVVLGWKSVDA